MLISFVTILRYLPLFYDIKIHKCMPKILGYFKGMALLNVKQSVG